MKEKTQKTLKIVFSILFASVVLAAFFFVIFGTIPADWKIEKKYLSFGCICACFLLSLLFVGKNSKKILITLALATNVAADYFLMLNLTGIEDAKLIGTCIFCGVQFFYFVYTLLLNKSIGAKVTNMAIRVALCLLAYFLLPQYFTLGTLEIVAVMYIINFAVNIFEVCLHIKTEWLTLIGLVLFFVCDIFTGLTNGGIEILKITGDFVNFITTYDIAYYCYIPGILTISLSSVWAKKKK